MIIAFLCFLLALVAGTAALIALAFGWPMALAVLFGGVALAVLRLHLMGAQKGR